MEYTKNLSHSEAKYKYLGLPKKIRSEFPEKDGKKLSGEVDAKHLFNDVLHNLLTLCIGFEAVLHHLLTLALVLRLFPSDLNR